MSLINPSETTTLFTFGDFENIIYRCLRLAFSTSPDATAQLRLLSEQLCGTPSMTTDSGTTTETSRSADLPSITNKTKELVFTSSKEEPDPAASQAASKKPKLAPTAGANTALRPPRRPFPPFPPSSTSSTSASSTNSPSTSSASVFSSALAQAVPKTATAISAASASASAAASKRLHNVLDLERQASSESEPDTAAAPSSSLPSALQGRLKVPRRPSPSAFATALCISDEDSNSVELMRVDSTGASPSASSSSPSSSASPLLMPDAQHAKSQEPSTSRQSPSSSSRPPTGDRPSDGTAKHSAPHALAKSSDLVRGSDPHNKPLDAPKDSEAALKSEQAVPAAKSPAMARAGEGSAAKLADAAPSRSGLDVSKQTDSISAKSTSIEPSKGGAEAGSGSGSGSGAKPSRTPVAKVCAICMMDMDHATDRLVACRECGAVYHQHCHTPAIEASRAASGRWTCFHCTSNSLAPAGGSPLLPGALALPPPSRARLRPPPTAASSPSSAGSSAPALRPAGPLTLLGTGSGLGSGSSNAMASEATQTLYKRYRANANASSTAGAHASGATSAAGASVAASSLSASSASAGSGGSFAAAAKQRPGTSKPTASSPDAVTPSTSSSSSSAQQQQQPSGLAALAMRSRIIK